MQTILPQAKEGKAVSHHVLFKRRLKCLLTAIGSAPMHQVRSAGQTTD